MDVHLVFLAGCQIRCILVLNIEKFNMHVFYPCKKLNKNIIQTLQTSFQWRFYLSLSYTQNPKTDFSKHSRSTLSSGSSFTLIAPSPYLPGDLLFDLSPDLDLFLKIFHRNDVNMSIQTLTINKEIVPFTQCRHQCSSLLYVKPNHYTDIPQNNVCLTAKTVTMAVVDWLWHWCH